MDRGVRREEWGERSGDRGMSREQWLERGRWRSGVIGVVRVGWLEEWL